MSSIFKLFVAVTGLLVLAVRPLRGEAASPPAKRPNILFIMTDQQRWDSIGANGNRQVRTPNLDRLLKWLTTADETDQIAPRWLLDSRSRQ